MKFRADYKISVIRVYADTAHVASHIDEHKVGADHIGDKVGVAAA